MSLNSLDTPAVGANQRFSISADGNCIAWSVAADGFLPFTLVLGTQIYARDILNATVVRASVNDAGETANFFCSSPMISADGKAVVFDSLASNLIEPALDSNQLSDVFLRDLVAGTTLRASSAPGGADADGDSRLPSVSGDGGVVAFESFASNLVSGDTNGLLDVYAYEGAGGSVVLLSKDAGGTPGNHSSYEARVSEDGRWVVFTSEATNLVPGDGNGSADVFLHDLQTSQTLLVSHDSAGNAANDQSRQPAISGDGSWIVYQSKASNIAGPGNGHWDIFLWSRQTDSTVRVTTGVNGDSTRPDLSGNGDWIAFESTDTQLVPGDGNGVRDIFVFERQAGTLYRASVATDGTEADADSADPRISDSQHVVFTTEASNLDASQLNPSCDGIRNGPPNLIFEPMRVSAGDPVSVTAGTVDPNVPLLLFVETLYGTLRVMVGSTDAGGIWRLGFTAPALAGWEFRCTAVTLLGGSPTKTCSATITFE